MFPLLIRIAITAILVLSIWKVGSQLVATQLPLDQSLEWDATHPFTYFQLGKYYRDDFDAYDLPRALENFQKAVELNPQAWAYWNELGRTYEFMGRLDEASNAYHRSVELSPLDADYRWGLANFELRRGRTETALEQFSAVLKNDPSKAAPCFELLVTAGLEIPEIEALWPTDLDSQKKLFELALNRDADPDWLDTRWQTILKSSREEPVSISWGQRYIGHLMKSERYAEARHEWIELTALNGVTDEAFLTNQNLLWNTDFTLPESASPFDWKITTSKAVTVERVNASSGSVSASARAGELAPTHAVTLSFAGAENFRGQILTQTLILDRGPHIFVYEAAAEEITTEQGPYFQIRDQRTGRQLAATEMHLGTVEPKRYEIEFELTEPAPITLSLIRNASKRIDNKIRGRLVIGGMKIARVTE